MLTTGRPLQVAVLCSRRAPGLTDLLEASSGRRSPFDITCVISSEPAFGGRREIEDQGIAFLSHPIAEFCRVRSSSVYRDPMTRRAYDVEMAGLLEPYEPDLVLLDGYLYLLTGPMLGAFRNRILNLHFSDLTLRRDDGRPAYVGIRAVRDALRDGREETCATVHLVNDEPDGGAPLVRSWPYPVSPMVARSLEWGALDLFKAYTFAHQEWMMLGASGPLWLAALQLIANGRMDLDALALRDPARVEPWLVDDRGVVTVAARRELQVVSR